jgi:hypothetical protein
MIQRIQSLYLLLALAVLLLIFFFPLSIYTDSNNFVYSLVHNGLAKYSNNEWVLVKSNFLSSIFLIPTCLIIILSIFLFNNRKRQIKLCWVSMITSILLFISFIIRYKLAVGDLNITNSNYSWPVIMPVVSAILAYLALKAIKKDDDLVKSADRIR